MNSEKYLPSPSTIAASAKYCDFIHEIFLQRGKRLNYDISGENVQRLAPNDDIGKIDDTEIIFHDVFGEFKSKLQPNLVSSGEIPKTYRLPSCDVATLINRKNFPLGTTTENFTRGFSYKSLEPEIINSRTSTKSAQNFRPN